jgi:Snf7
MAQWLKSWISGPPQPVQYAPPRPIAATEVANEADMLRAWKAQQAKNTYDIGKLNKELQQCVERQDRAAAKAIMIRKKDVETRNQALAQKIRAIEQVSMVKHSAETNVSLARVMRDGVSTMRQHAAEIDTMNVDDVVDDLREAADEAAEYERLLTEGLPGFGEPTLADQDAMENELDALMAQNAPTQTSVNPLVETMPSVPTSTPTRVIQRTTATNSANV